MAKTNPQPSTGPLHGIRVLDLTRILAGPWASQLLADYGAEVIKIERPGSGDDTRAWGPPWLRDANGEATADSAYFLAANRNKRSMALDLSQADGVQIALKLVARSDVVMENFKVGTMQKFGLGFGTLQRVNPSVILCSLSGFGQSGSRSSEPGYDATVQAAGGLMSITGEASTGPQKVGVAIADLMAGMYAATAVLAALVSRAATGAGQHIDVALYDSQVASLANQGMNFLVGGQTPGRLGTAHPNLVPYQVFATRDGHLMLAVGNDRQFRSCVTCLGAPAMADDERFRTNSARVVHRDSLVPLLADLFAQGDTDSWLQALNKDGVPVAPINSIATVFSEEYALERGFVQTLQHDTAGPIPTVANPVKFSATPVDYRHAPPSLGQHTTAILSQELGLTAAEIESLAMAGTI